MAASLEKFRDRWERMAPRERMLLGALAATLVVCLFVWVGLSIRNGLNEIETKNDLSRDALRALAQYRSGQATQASKGPEAKITEEAVELDSYLEGIVNQLGLESPAYPSAEEEEKGGFVEISMSGIKMPDLTIYELKDLLQRIETKQRTVVIKELRIKRDFRDEEKLDVEMTVATYRKASGGGGEGEEGE